MLTLSLLRHAKSDWSAPGMDDFDRPLSARGQDAAPRMGAYMAQAGLRPRLILCSAALRTRQTLDLVLPFLSAGSTVEIERGLYLASSATMIGRLRQVPGDVPHVLMIGHDPGMHETALALAGRGAPDALGALAHKFPTAALAVFACDVPAWSDVGPGLGHLLRFVTPRSLGRD